MNSTELEMVFRIVKSIWKRKYVVLFCIATYLIVGVIYVSNCDKMYQAHADINLLIMSSKKTFNLEELGEEVIKSEEVIASAIKMLKRIPKYQRPNPIRPSGVRDFSASLSVRTKRRAKNIISLSFQSRSPELAADSLETLIKSFEKNLNEMFAKVVSEDSSMTPSEVRRLRKARQKMRTAVLESILKKDGLNQKSPEAVSADADLLLLLNNIDLDPPRFEVLRTNPPHASLTPVAPHKTMYLTFFFLIGSMWGVIAATFLEYRDKSFQSPLSISRLLSTPLFQTIEEMGNVTPATELPTQLAHRVSGLRINLELFANNPHSLLITSPQTGVGKTLITHQLARAFSEAGEKVLVIDASWEMEQGREIQSSTDVPRGFSDLLCDCNGSSGSLSSVVIEKEGGVYHLIPQGCQTESVLAKMSRENIRNIFSAALQMYDRVLIDAASTNSSLLTTALAQVAEGTLLVVTEHSNQKDAAVKACQNLSASGCHITGIIANRIPESRQWQAGYIDARVTDGLQTAPAGFLPATEQSSHAHASQNVLPMQGYNKHAA